MTCALLYPHRSHLGILRRVGGSPKAIQPTTRSATEGKLTLSGVLLLDWFLWKTLCWHGDNRGQQKATNGIPHAAAAASIVFNIGVGAVVCIIRVKVLSWETVNSCKLREDVKNVQTASSRIRGTGIKTCV